MQISVVHVGATLQESADGLAVSPYSRPNNGRPGETIGVVRVGVKLQELADDAYLPMFGSVRQSRPSRARRRRHPRVLDTRRFPGGLLASRRCENG